MNDDKTASPSPLAVPRPVRPKYQIFVSSTFGDLHQERQAVTWELLKLGHIPTGMENFSADPDRGWRVIRRTIDQSDYYVLLLAGRYGSTFDETQVSWTEREYRYAQEQKVPVIAFIRDRKAITSDLMDVGEKYDRLEAFKKRVQDSHLVETWSTQDDLRARVAAAIPKKIQDDEDEGQPRPGWYRGGVGVSPAVMEELARLSAESHRLRAENEQLRARPATAGSAQKQLWLGELQQLKTLLEDGMTAARRVLPPFYQRLSGGYRRSDEIDHVIANLGVPDEPLVQHAREFVALAQKFADQWFQSESSQTARGMESGQRREAFLQAGGKEKLDQLELLLKQVKGRINVILE